MYGRSGAEVIPRNKRLEIRSNTEDMFSGTVSAQGGLDQNP